jgi:hypothetical protein
MTGENCSSLTSRGFVTPGVMVGFAFIVEGMSVTPRPELVVITGIALSLKAISMLCVTGKTSSSLMWYPSPQAHPDMTLQHDNATGHTVHTNIYT